MTEPLEKRINADRPYAQLIVGTVLCKLYGNDDVVHCKCEADDLTICHLACDFMDDAEVVLKAIEALP